MPRTIERPDQESLHNKADGAHNQRNGNQTKPEVPSQREEKQPDIGSNHIEGAMREVHHCQHAEYQRQADSEQHIDCTERQTREQLQRDQIETQACHKYLRI